jgi:hypothetical protein
MRVLNNEMLLARLDTFGWFVVFFVGLLFGIPYTRYFLRVKSIPTWPTTMATVTQASAVQGAPTGYALGASLLHHCSVYYEFQASGVTYRGWFALMTGDEVIASRVAQELMHTKIPIRYSPMHPADSLPVEKQVLGRKVFLRQSWLNPDVW